MSELQIGDQCDILCSGKWLDGRVVGRHAPYYWVKVTDTAIDIPIAVHGNDVRPGPPVIPEKIYVCISRFRWERMLRNVTSDCCSFGRDCNKLMANSDAIVLEVFVPLGVK